MTKRDVVLLIFILFLAGLTLFVDLNIDHPAWFENLLFWRPEGARNIEIRYGLDLRGGLKVLLAADLPPGQEVDPVAMETARRIVEDRVNSLGLTEAVVQAQGDRRIIVELPGIEDPELAVETIRGTALLEFIDTGGVFLPPGTVVTTTLGPPRSGFTSTPTTLPVTPSLSLTPTVPLTPTTSPTSTATISPTTPVTPTPRAPVYRTILTGAGLEQVGLDRTQTNQYEIPFQLKPDAAEVFAEFTAAHAPPPGQRGYYPLCIVLDKRVLSCPVIESAIPDGRGTIRLGDATYEEARNLAIQLHYGALPVPLRVETVSTVGPTLGEISVQRSIRAGVVGLSVVLLFMLVYYRLPGSLADVALLIYALLNLAIYKLAPVTLTLPGIAGFLLSAGMAVDANILVFERMKEELRIGRGLRRAIEAGFDRAWTSIRDSQASTLIVCAVLYFFGTNFGASMVKGFAITLAIGTLINLFTAVVVTRTFIRAVFHVAGEWIRSRRWLLGV
ncbi:MAG TPA: protein translocase subunit SecD [Anaerolineales bacterium]|nr:protein translocase subunit SecD [Anaerolineales bacterium]